MTISVYAPIDDPSQLNDIRLRMLLAHWTAASTNGQFPNQDFVDPLKLGDLMGWLFLYRVERDPMRFRYLLYGPKIARRIGFDLTGKYVHDHPIEEARTAIGNLLTAVATTGRPHRGVSKRVMLDQEIRTEAVVLPLGGLNGIVDHLLALQIYEMPADPSLPGSHE